MINKLLLSLFCISFTYANSTKITQTKDLSLTIYNNNLAMVNETRDINIKNNKKQELIYEGIASSVIFESIIPTFSKQTTLYSQNYKYDILSLNKLLQKNINKIVKYKVQTAQFKYKIKSAKLLSTNPIMLKNDKYIISNIDAKDIVFDKIPEDLLTIPSLVWEIKSKKGKQDIKLNYLTRGISWKSDYILNLDDKNSLSAWISIVNNSGAVYKNANIYCIAGDVKTVNKSNNYNTRAYSKMSLDSVASAKVSQKEFAGYHLYKIPFKQTLNNKQKKQIRFMNKKDINIKEYASITNNIYTYRFKNINNIKFNHKIDIQNKLSNNMGIPLPKGIIRVYKNDNEISHFIGQDNLKHTAINEKISLNIGKYFDITQKITQVKFHKTKHSVKSKYKRVIKNSSSKSQTIKILENNYSNNIKSIENKNNCKENCSIKKVGLNSYEYTIKLKPKSQYELETKYDIEYERY